MTFLSLEEVGDSSWRFLSFLSSTFASTALFCAVIERGLAADGRLVRFKVAVPDRPGSIARLTELVSNVRRMVRA